MGMNEKELEKDTIFRISFIEPKWFNFIKKYKRRNLLKKIQKETGVKLYENL